MGGGCWDCGCEWCGWYVVVYQVCDCIEIGLWYVFVQCVFYQFVICGVVVVWIDVQCISYMWVCEYQGVEQFVLVFWCVYVVEVWYV